MLTYFIKPNAYAFLSEQISYPEIPEILRIEIIFFWLQKKKGHIHTVYKFDKSGAFQMHQITLVSTIYCLCTCHVLVVSVGSLSKLIRFHNEKK